jgi:hypothetical protein
MRLGPITKDEYIKWFISSLKSYAPPSTRSPELRQPCGTVHRELVRLTPKGGLGRHHHNSPFHMSPEFTDLSCGEMIWRRGPQVASVQDRYGVLRLAVVPISSHDSALQMRFPRLGVP